MDPGNVADVTTPPLPLTADHFRLLVDSLSDYAICLLTPDGRLASWNTGAERTTGFDTADVLGRPFSTMFGADEAADRRARAIMHAALSNSKHEEEGRQSRKDGSVYWALVTVTALREHERHVGFAVVLRDISERKRQEDELRANEARLRTALVAGRMGTWNWDIRTNRSVWNEQVFLLLGLVPTDGPLSTDTFFERVHRDDLPALRQTLDVALTLGEPFASEFRVVLPDGAVRWLAGAGQVVRDAAGTPIEMYGINYDVTDRKQHEDALRHSERRFRSLTTATTSIVWTADPDGQVAVEMTGWREFSGMSEEDSAGWGWLAAVHADDRDRAGARWRAATATQQPYLSEYRMRRADGAWRDMVVRAVPVRDDHGVVCEWVGLCVDETDRKEAERALTESEQRFRSFMDHTPAQVWITDEGGVCRFVNAALARDLGRSVTDLVGRPIGDIMAGFDVDEYLAGDRRVLETGDPVQSVVAAPRRDEPDGRFLVYKFALSSSSDGSRQVGGVAIDITDRERAQEDLRVSEARFRTLVTTLSHIVWICDPQGEHATSTPSWAEFTGLSEEEASGWGWVRAVHPVDRDDVSRVWQTALATVQPFDTEYRLRRADGQWRHIAARGIPILRADGTVREWVGVCIDDTERHDAEAGMRLRERVMGLVSQGILITDPNEPDNPIIYASRGVQAMTGYALEETLGRNCRFLQGKDTDPDMLQTLREAIAAERECAVEILNYRKDGTPFWNALHVTPVRDVAGTLTHFVGMQVDVTDRKRLEQQFQQAQKMEAVGRLAGGVAHDFNNLLTIINGYAEMVMEHFPPDSAPRGMVAEIHRAGERAGALTRQLLVFSRQSVLEPRIIDLNTAVMDTERMLRRVIGEDVRLATALAPSLPPVRVDPGQFEQAMLNLAVNARDAMPQGGNLTIETHDVTISEEQCDFFPDCSPGQYSMVSISDTGTGMDDVVRNRMFEPFFTTKEPGRGTGLGLAMVYGFVKASRGHVNVYSEPGHGTTFKLYLPQIVGPVSPDTTHSRATPMPGGTETLLLAEDDDDVRALTRRVLQTLGYTVLAASNGKDAIQLAETHQGAIHLLVSDVVMPHIGGRRAAERILELRPGIKVLFCSGYTDDAVLRHNVLDAGMPFIQKPYSPAVLARTVRAVLDGKA